jgi:Putative Ig domain
VRRFPSGARLFLGSEMQHRLALLPILLLSQAGLYSASDISIFTRDSLVLTQGRYATIVFKAEAPASKNGVPIQFTFATSGQTPPGMIFESYPCNKPGMQHCPALASSDSIYLDGVPTTPGSYRVTITAKDARGESRSRDFTITVQAR